MVVLGKVTGPYGVRGWVSIHPFADDPAAWAKMPAWWLGIDEGCDWQETKIRASRLHGGGLVCQFEGFVDRTQAETLTGKLVAAPREALPATRENEYYWVDLIGLEVVNTTGETLGTVKGLIETGANDVLQVVSDKGEQLLPFVSPIVQTVEKSSNGNKGRIRVDWGSDW